MTGATGLVSGWTTAHRNPFRLSRGATNAIATRTFASPESGPVAPRQLDTQPMRSSTAGRAARSPYPRALSVAGPGHNVLRPTRHTQRPSRFAPNATSIVSRRTAHRQRRHVKVGPAALSTIADGAHDLTVTAGRRRLRRATPTRSLPAWRCASAGATTAPAAIALSARPGCGPEASSSREGSVSPALERARSAASRLARAGLPDMNLSLPGTHPLQRRHRHAHPSAD